MPLASGAKIGAYEVLAPIGAGGMGEVYRALDPKLGREVAIKVLSDQVSADTDRMLRFQREAQILAALNHPHIGAIYGIEDSRQGPALVMELVEGPTLADRIVPGPVSSEEALSISRQIAEALEYAHDRGVIHRDLKPANIKVTEDGEVKVLDFGLAKVLQGETPAAADASNSPTFTAATQMGVVLGTAAYMSPEQAKGRRVDRRTDIWAFGCVLYEMLTGRGCFGGETVTDTLAAILREEPDWSRLPPNVPMRIRDLLRRCLTKDLKQRLQAIGEARIAIDEAGNSPQSAQPATSRRSAWTLLLPWTVAALFAFAFLLASAQWWRSSHPQQAVMKFDVSLAPDQAFNFEGHAPVAISPDGLHIAYALRQGAEAQLYVRALDSLEPTPLAGTEGAFGPFFSPDGRMLAFFAKGKLMKVPVLGGPVVQLCDTSGNPRGGTWSTNGSIYAALTATSAVMRIPQDGGTPQPFTSIDTAKRDRTHRWPQALPDGDHVLFTVGTMDSPEYYDDSEIDVVSASTGQRSVVLKGARMAFYVSTGQLVYARGTTLFAVPFDLKRLAVTGSATPLFQNVSGDPTDGASFFSISRAGLIYVAGPEVNDRSLLSWVDRSGNVRDLPAPPHHYRDMRISPDGKRVAVGISEKTQDIWIYDFTSRAMNRLTFEGQNQVPVWTADGKRIFYMTNQGSGQHLLKWISADGSSPAEGLSAVDSTIRLPMSVTPDGRYLAYTNFADGNASISTMILLSVQGEHKEQPFSQTDSNGDWPTFSPDGNWLVYAGKQGSQTEIFVQPHPPTGGRWQISTQGGTEPMWSGNGRYIFYRDLSDNLMVSRVNTTQGFHASTPETYFKGLYRASGALQTYAVSKDDRQVLILRATRGAEIPNHSVMILNWIEELRRLSAQNR